MKNITFLITLVLILSCGKEASIKKLAINPKVQTDRYILHKSFPSKNVDNRDIEVWLPNGYDSTKALPVLYMFDGQNIFHGRRGWNKSQYNHGWQVDEILDSLFDIESIPKIIVVGISHLGKKRYSEYTPAKPRSEINKRKSKADISLLEVYDKHGITSDKFLKFMVEELKPFIDRNYKTNSGRDGTFLAGSSMGGLISAYAICEYPNVFGGAACMSTHWPVMDGFFIEYLKSNLPNPLTHKIYFDYGTLGLDAEYEPYQVVVDSLMVLNGYEIKKNWITKKFEGDNHHEDYWRRRFHHPIKFLLNENK